MSLERRALIAGLLAAATPLPAFAKGVRAGSAEALVVALDVQLGELEGYIQYLSEFLTRVESLSPLPDGAEALVDRIESIACDAEDFFSVDSVGGDIDGSPASDASELLVAIKPTDSFIDLVVACRAFDRDHGFAGTLDDIHVENPSLDGVVTPSKGGEGDGVKSSPFACQMGAA